MNKARQKESVAHPVGRPFLIVGLLVVSSAAIIGSRLVIGSGQTAQDQPPRPTFRTEANYVRVDVFPTKDGVPVQDLTQGDFEIVEDRVPQRIEQFEHVVIRGAGPQETRIEPNNVRDMRSMLENSRARVLVLFLDTHHVEVEGSHNIRKPLVDALDHVIGSDDLIGVMTPEMSPTDIAFARKTTTIDGFLTRYWYWGERERLKPVDPIEDEYYRCFPGNDAVPGCQNSNGIAAAMIERRREKLTLDALQDLVRYLRGIREERKAILAISDGWRLFRPDQSLARPINCQAPSGNDVQVDPRTGKLTARGGVAATANTGVCERDRMTLANIDDEREFREILDEANRANATFYPIDPRGLVVFDTPIAPANGPAITTPAPTLLPSADQRWLQARLTSLRTLAEATDGIAIVNSNDLATGLRRVVSDLSSYYLLGYYSNGKLDGKFHAISVRVKRPGVQVRARRGYLAAPPNAINAAAASAAAAATPAKIDAELAAVTAAVVPLGNYGRDVPFRVQAAAGWKPGEPASAAVWVEGELSSAREFEDLWKAGAVATIDLAPPDGATVGSARVTVAPGSRTFRAILTSAQPLAPGDYVIRVGARSPDSTAPTRETIPITIPPSPRATGAIWMRRGLSTGNRETATADLRFRRSEQATVEIPTVATEAGTARLLDRTGKPLAVPVSASIRNDADGSRWLTAQLALAPLAPGDYVIEMSEASERILAAFRIVP